MINISHASHVNSTSHQNPTLIYGQKHKIPLNSKRRSINSWGTKPVHIPKLKMGQLLLGRFLKPKQKIPIKNWNTTQTLWIHQRSSFWKLWFLIFQFEESNRFNGEEVKKPRTRNSKKINAASVFFFERQKFYKTKTSKELEITNYMREKAILGNCNQPTQSIVNLLFLFVAQKNERITILSHKSPFLSKEYIKNVSFLKDQITTVCSY